MIKKWFGSAAVCINEDKEFLKVKGINFKTWAIPSGGIEEGEVKEETGYDIVIEDNLFIKETEIKGYKLLLQSEGIYDPDNIIVDAGWKSLRDIKKCDTHIPKTWKFYGVCWNRVRKINNYRDGVFTCFQLKRSWKWR